MLSGPRAQIFFALSALLSPALCAAVDDPASRTPAERPFIGLLLPLNAPDFARAAEAVRLGCQAALVFAENRQVMRVLRTDARPENILAEYEAAVQSGAAVIVGPMTRSGVSALAAAGRVSVATLALNVADGDAPLPPRLYTFGLSVDAEARIVARMAFARGLRAAVGVQASSVLAKRLSLAFADLRRGRADSQAQLTFLAAEPDQARTVRPYLNNQMAVFATSQINDGKTGPLVNSDLNGVRFVDMPWLVQPDHAAVMVYPRLEGFSTELQRFYALGIDSCRIAGELLSGQQRVSLDGVTGKISYHGGNALEREPVQAVFRDGVGVSTEDSR